MDDDLENTIRQAVREPTHVASDGQSVQARPIPDLIAADNHLAAKQAKCRNHQGIVFTRLEPGGCG